MPLSPPRRPWTRAQHCLPVHRCLQTCVCTLAVTQLLIAMFASWLTDQRGLGSVSSWARWPNHSTLHFTNHLTSTSCWGFRREEISFTLFLMGWRRTSVLVLSQFSTRACSGSAVARLVCGWEGALGSMHPHLRQQHQFLGACGAALAGLGRSGRTWMRMTAWVTFPVLLQVWPKIINWSSKSKA